jgi:hypothetical protein
MATIPRALERRFRDRLLQSESGIHGHARGPEEASDQGLRVGARGSRERLPRCRRRSPPGVGEEAQGRHVSPRDPRGRELRRAVIAGGLTLAPAYVLTLLGIGS